ncbi:MAG: leucyl aminopeptidase, partial [Lutimaribacter sp.]
EMPVGLQAVALDLVCLPRRPTQTEARRAGAQLAKRQGAQPLLVLAGATVRISELALGLALRGYAFDVHRKTPAKRGQGVRIMCTRPAEAQANAAPLMAMAEGVFFTRDLTNEPANVLTTTEFAARLQAMADLGLKIEVLDEAQLHELGMDSFLSVGQGSASPTKLVVMQWQGGPKDQAPLALVGKGVVFDTGGISLKPAAGMEDMTMDMGGAGVVAGVMRSLALRGAKANVVGLVGLVENMPSGTATRPGDVVRSMKGDTIEVLNTDAEGRLVLADVLWYAQERFGPRGVIDLATLTGAIMVALGKEHAGLFSNNDELAQRLSEVGYATGEKVWRMPLAPEYDKIIDHEVADVKNTGGRNAGAITAAQFLQRFVNNVPWVHLDV